MAFRWSEDTTLKFVAEYLKYECLWNIKSPLYKNKQIKQSAYVDLENAMNISGFGEMEIKLNIKNIRSTYSQELKKIKESENSGAGTDTVYIPSLKWLSLLNGTLRNITSILTESESNLLCEDSSHTNTDTEEDNTPVDTFREPKPKSTPPTKRKKPSQLSSMVTQLKEISETANSIAEENEFEVFGKHVGIQLKSLPLLLALEAQEHIQLYINRIGRQHLQNASEPARFTTTVTPLSSYDSQDFSYSNTSTYNEHNYFEDQPTQGSQFTSQSIISIHNSKHDKDIQSSSIMLPSDNVYNIEKQRNATITSNDIILTVMNKANVDD